MPFDLAPGIAAYLACALLLAAIVRGYTGFGFSAIVLSAAALVTNPLPLIPVLFMAEIAMTTLQLRAVRDHADWRRALALLGGAALILPLAFGAMLALPADLVRLTVSLVIGAMALLLLTGWTLTRPLGPAGHVGVGVIAGAANAAGVGGLPVAACLGAQPIAPATFRATMVVFLTGIDILSLPLLAWGGQITADTFRAALLAAPILALGLTIGSRRFDAAPPATFRRLATWLLLLLSGLGLIRSLA